ncbi:MAG: FhaA domain-containing protein [Gulosibacter sp.]|uniref:FhaA domain-containing protein n=1 Tax=Gulosibacter sp. TaxID=2817531 RepID=UPI003F8EF261
MGILDKIERGLERAFNGAFAKTFRSGLQPVEIVSALKREMDTKASIVSRQRILVPNRFHVLVSPTDYDRLASMGDSLKSSLMHEVESHAASHRYQFPGGLSIKLLQDDSLGVGQLGIESRSVEGRVNWTPVLEVNGMRFPLNRGSNIIGRGSEAQVTIDDGGASRKHAEIVWDGQRAGLRDFGSTNGTKLNGRRVAQSALEPDSLIEIGRTQLTFRIVPEAQPSDDTGYLRRPGGNQ